MADLSQLTPQELANTPSVPPPAGVTPDFEGKNPGETSAIVVTSLFMGLAFLCTAVRIYSKFVVWKRGSWDDLFYGLGLTSTLVYWIVFLLQVVNEGFGRHFWNVPLIVTMSDAFLKLAYVSDWLCNIAYLFVKLSIFALYWTIFNPVRWLRFGIVGGASIVALVYSGCTLASLIPATPSPSQSWIEKAQHSPNRIGLKLSVPLAIFALVSDIYLLLLPISGVLRLHLSQRQKFGLVIVFLTGVGACICSSLSVYYRTILKESDVTYTVTKVQIIIVVELSVGMLISCVPSIAAVLRQISKAYGLTWSTRKGGSSRGNHVFKNGTDSNGTNPEGPYWNLKMRKNLSSSGPDDDYIAKENNHQLYVYPASNIKTHVVSGPSTDLSDDRIHLKIDIEQSGS